MAGVLHNIQEEPVKLKRKGWAKNRHLFPVFERIFAKLGIEISVDGMDIQQTSKGVHIKGDGGGDGDNDGYPWKLTPGTTAGDHYIQYAEVNGIEPSLGAGMLGDDPRPQLTIGSGEDPFVKLSIEPIVFNKGTVANPKWWITGSTVTAVEVLADTTPTGTPATVDRDTGTTTDGEYYRRISVLQEGRWNNSLRASLQVKLCDDGEGNGELSTGVAS